jgi:sensor c-di-GMP phosphodiesterase-like protein
MCAGVQRAAERMQNASPFVWRTRPNVKRAYIISLTVLLVALGVLLPILGMVWYSAQLAQQTEDERLAAMAERAIARANASFASAIEVLHAMDAAPLVSCSREHIELMRRNTTGGRAVEEVGYFENGLLKCTSWGVTTQEVHQTTPDFTTPQDMGVKIRVQTNVVPGFERIAVQYKSHNVLMDPARFVDVLVDSDMQLVVASSRGIIVGTLHAPDEALVTSILATRRSGMNAEFQYAVVQRDGWLAAAIQPRSRFISQLRHDRQRLLPLGLVIAALNSAVVIWFSRRRLSPLAELETAVRNREFVVHYQPIMALETGVCIGAEALVRWRRPDGSMVRPDLFIPLAEESGLILRITDQVFEGVVADLRSVLESDRALHVAVNLCSSDISTGRVMGVIDNVLAHTQIHPEQIWLEATERGFVDVDAARTHLAALRRRGHLIAVDDFGTGYSSLQYLQGLPLDVLKIDRAFVQTIGTGAATSAVIEHIIAMAQGLGLRMVAEGVETEAQAAYLRERRVDFVQGWLYARAMPAAEFLTFYRSAHTDTAAA